MHRADGSDRCAFFVECLWHKAQILILECTSDLEDGLVSFASELSTYLAPGPVFGAALRDKAATLIEDDEEFSDALDEFPGVFERLIETVRNLP